MASKTEQDRQTKGKGATLKEAVAKYANIMQCVSAYADYERRMEEAQSKHTLLKEPPTEEERKRARREYKAIYGTNDDDEKWESTIDAIILKNRVAAEVPPIPFTDKEERGIVNPFCAAIVDGGDPFPAEWKYLRGALEMSDLRDRICAGVERRHETFVASLGGGNWQTIAEAARSLAEYFSGQPPSGTEDCKMTIKAFAKKCGVSLRTVKNWIAGKNTKPIVVYFPDLKKDVTFSKELLKNPIEAEKFAMLYKQHKQIKRGMRNKESYNGEKTDAANEKKKRGIPKSTEYHDAEDSAEIGRLTGYQGSSWNGYQ